jgi:hypothetical protein
MAETDELVEAVRLSIWKEWRRKYSDISFDAIRFAARLMVERLRQARVSDGVIRAVLVEGIMPGGLAPLVELSALNLEALETPPAEIIFLRMREPLTLRGALVKSIELEDQVKEATGVKPLLREAVDCSTIEKARSNRPTVCYCAPGKCSAPKPEWCVGRRACELEDRVAPEDAPPVALPAHREDYGATGRNPPYRTHCTAPGCLTPAAHVITDALSGESTIWCAEHWDPELLAPIRTCRICGCTDENCSGCIAKTGMPCHWVDVDLCSACVFPDQPKRKQA